MNNDINFLTGIQDPGLQLDKGGTETIGNKIKVIHLVKTGECRCPVCGRQMLKNGFRPRTVVVTALSVAGMKTILMIRKQKYICKSSTQCPRIVTKVASIHGIRRGCLIANNVKQYIIKDLHRNISQKELAKNYYFSASTVARTIDALEG